MRATMRIGVWVLPTLLAQVAPAVDQPILDLRFGRDGIEHRMGPEPVVPGPWDGDSNVLGTILWDVELIVDEKGKVIEVTQPQGTDARTDAVRQTAMTMHFQPFEHGGHPVRALVEAGEDVNAVDAEGKTALESTFGEEAALALLQAGVRLPQDPKPLQAMIERAKKEKWSRLLPMLERAAASGTK